MKAITVFLMIVGVWCLMGVLEFLFFLLRWWVRRDK